MDHHERQRTTTSSRKNMVTRASAAVENNVNRARNSILLFWDDLPAWQQDNQHIRSGYRPVSNSHAKSIHSLTYLHNESVNIYTHLIGMILVSFLGLAVFSTARIRYHAASWPDILAMSSFFLSAALCLGLSTTYHTLSNHSPRISNLGNKLDLLGIVCLIWGSMVSIIYYGWYCERNIKISYCTMVSNAPVRGKIADSIKQITVFGAVCAYLSVNPKVRTPKWRTFRAVMFVSLGLSAVIPVIHGVRLYGLTVVNARIAFVPWLLIEGLMYILGASVYAVSPFTGAESRAPYLLTTK